jgi:aryl-alcohol dehydrogenase-like predicted oxidoreductase
MTLTGYATSAGTTRYRERFNANAAPGYFREQQNLALSSIGLGTYLGNPDAETDTRYTAATVRAVELGANVIDTAANYRFQRSERAIGAALRELIASRGFARAEIVICTKGGYLPFDSAPPRDVRRYVEETFVKPGIASFTDIVGGSHCMTPAYLENQLQQSLENLQLDCIDVYYIHNPESQLGQVSEPEFYHRLRSAFASLEKNRAEGRLQFYGVATWNGFRVASGSSGYHSLARMVATAREVGGEAHGFRFIQLPFNLAMPEALTSANQELAGEPVSTLEAAAAFGVTLISSASIFQGRVAQGLPADLRESLGSLPTDAQAALQFVRSAPGVTTALVGMSNPSHVAENLELVNVEPLKPAEFMKLFSAA